MPKENGLRPSARNMTSEAARVGSVIAPPKSMRLGPVRQQTGDTTAAAGPYSFLTNMHPIYRSQRNIWVRNERRLAGGDEVMFELWPFQWENTTGVVIAADGSTDVVSNHYRWRQSMATYVNFPEEFALLMTGHLMKSAPKPNFGTLGKVRELNEISGDLSNAELVYYNSDGVGHDGTQWDNFWAGAQRRAMATGHRWVMVEATSSGAVSKQDILDGKRPYLVEWSPIDVYDWHFENGQLQYAIIRLNERQIMVENGAFVNQSLLAQSYLLLVRKGFKKLGAEFEEGGWFRYTPDLEQDKDGIGYHGKFDMTDGEIPLFPLFYQRDAKPARRLVPLNQTMGEQPMPDILVGQKMLVQSPAMSRPGISELGNVAVSYMNLASAADFDAWDAASSLTFMMGVDKEGYNLAKDKMDAGSRLIPVPSNQESGGVPTVHDSGSGVTVAQVFDVRLKAKREEAKELAAREISSTPDASAVSKQAGFNEVKSPRLAIMASELEQAQNIAIWFLEKRFGGGKPTGGVVWPREFDLLELTQQIDALFNREKLSGLRSPTLDAKAMTLSAGEDGLIENEAERRTILAEYTESAKKAAAAPLPGTVPPVVPGTPGAPKPAVGGTADNSTGA